jgi:hypothetical protein
VNIPIDKRKEKIMKRILEIIELRSVIKNRYQLIKLIEDLLENVFRKPNMEIKIYTHSKFITDYSIHLNYGVEEELNEESYLGHELSSYLREYGLVSHNIWIEENIRGNKNEQ